MDQFWKWFLDWWPSIATAATSFVVSLASLLIYRLKLRKKEAKNKALTEELNNARAANTYTKCPHCGHSVFLKELHFYLPGDLKDDNLNQVPDIQE